MANALADVFIPTKWSPEAEKLADKEYFLHGTIKDADSGLLIRFLKENFTFIEVGAEDGLDIRYEVRYFIGPPLDELYRIHIFRSLDRIEENPKIICYGPIEAGDGNQRAAIRSRYEIDVGHIVYDNIENEKGFTRGANHVHRTLTYVSGRVKILLSKLYTLNPSIEDGLDLAGPPVAWDMIRLNRRYIIEISRIVPKDEIDQHNPDAIFEEIRQVDNRIRPYVVCFKENAFLTWG